MTEQIMFCGRKEQADAYLRSIAGRYYVYVLCRPDGEPFYVGKGLNKRALEHEAEARRHHPVGETNPFKCNVIRKIIREGGEVRYRIDSVFEVRDQQSCLAREAALIGQYRRLHEGGSLTNLAGGIGTIAGSSPFSLARHAATLSGEPEHNPERATLNRFLQSIGPVESVPIKPLRQIARILPTTPHPSPRSPTVRCAFALVASASAAGLQLVAGARVPRAFVYQGVSAIIENGVSRDIVKAGMATLVSHRQAEQEKFVLSTAQAELLLRLVGKGRLQQLGLT